MSKQEQIAKEIWLAEYEYSASKVRSLPWEEIVSEKDKEKYRYIAKRIMELKETD